MYVDLRGIVRRKNLQGKQGNVISSLSSRIEKSRNIFDFDLISKVVRDYL